MNAIEIKNLTKRYKGFTLDNISLTLPKGFILGLVGENGAGKSTLIRLLLGMCRPNEGAVTLLGHEGKDSYLAKEDIGFVLDDMGLNGSYKLRNVDSLMKCAYRRWNSEQFYSMAEKLGVPKDKKISKMSKGMRMKLGIAIALSHDAKLLILDEATNGLDPVVRDEVTDIFYDFIKDEEHSILISSHIVSDLEKVCDYIAFLHKGKLLLCEEKDRLYEDYALLRCTWEQLSEIDEKAVIGKRVNSYGAEAVVLRDSVPKGMNLSPADIETLFIFMVKENENENESEK